MPRDAAACLSEAYLGSTLLVTTTTTIITLHAHVRVALALEVAGDAQLPQGRSPCSRSYWRGWGGRRLRD